MSNQIIEAVKFTGGKPQVTSETLTGEQALQIKINNKAYTITMRSPGNDVPLAVGLLLTEGIIKSFADIISIAEIPVAGSNGSIVMDIQLPEKILEGKNLFNRSIASSASCGICGKTELCDLQVFDPPLIHDKYLDINLLGVLFNQMQMHQNTFGLTGGSHAAAIFSSDGGLLSVHEDIGRHNAVDKVIGEILINNTQSLASILCVSGRVSYEIAVKCFKAGIPFLAAVSAPSTLSVEFCNEKGLTLIAFCRGDKATVYTYPEKIIQYSAQTLKSVSY